MLLDAKDENSIWDRGILWGILAAPSADGILQGSVRPSHVLPARSGQNAWSLEAIGCFVLNYHRELKRPGSVPAK